MTNGAKKLGRLAEMNGGYVVLYQSDYGFCMRGKDPVLRPAMRGVSGVFLDRDAEGKPLAAGQSSFIHEGLLAGHVRLFEAQLMPEATELSAALAAAEMYGVELVWPVLECTRIFKEQEAANMRRIGEMKPFPESFPIPDHEDLAVVDAAIAKHAERPKGAPGKRKR